MTKPTDINRLVPGNVGPQADARGNRLANKLLEARKGDPAGALQDVFWVVLNSGEFILNH